MSATTLPSSPSTAVSYTVEDVLSRPDGEKYELVEGELRETAMSQESSWIAGEIYRQIANHAMANQSGWAFPDGTSYAYSFQGDERLRRPDATFIKSERLPAGPTSWGVCHVLPDLAVEVLSPNDRFLDVIAKVDEYLAVGVLQVWVIIPTHQTMFVYSANGDLKKLTAQDQLTGGAELPGFQCQVKSLFPAQQAITSP